jgi:MFS family permease
LTIARTPRLPPIALLLTAKAISDVGFALDFVCLGVFAWVRTQSALVTAAVGLCLYAGGVVGGRLGQRFGAGWDRRWAMVAADAGRAGVLVVLALAPGPAQLWWLFPAVLGIGAGRSVFEATLAAATPAMAGPARIQAVNSAVSAVRGGALVVGMGLATVAVPVIGFRGVFALDAASYALSAAAVLTLPLRLREAASTPAGTAGRRGPGWAVLAGGGLVALVGVRGLDAFGSASHHIGLPMLGSLRDPANPAHVVGGAWMVWAGGLLVGSLAVRPLLARTVAASPVPVFGVATAVMSAGFIGIFWLHAWPAMLAAAAVAGVGDALSEITFKQALQALPDTDRGVAFGSVQIVLNVGFTAGVGLVGVTATPGRIAAVVLAMHGIALIAAAGLAIRTRPRLRPVALAMDTE